MALSPTNTPLFKTTTYQYQDHANDWVPLPGDGNVSPGAEIQAINIPARLVIASYNVSRLPELVEALVGNDGCADVVILQDVDSLFLSALLKHPSIQAWYRFSTHGSLASNESTESSNDWLYISGRIVVLGRHQFRWHVLLPGESKHRFRTDPACIAVEIDGAPMVVVACGPVRKTSDDTATNPSETNIATMLECVRSRYAQRHRVLVGDFGAPSSAATSASPSESEKKIVPNRIEEILAQEGMYDAWLMARCHVGESSGIDGWLPLPLSQLDAIGEGEQGYTFEPPCTAHTGLHGDGRVDRVCCRPQRRNRILVYPRGGSRVGGFNMFGPRQERLGMQHAGIHRGIRCLLEEVKYDADTNDVVGAMGLEMLAMIEPWVRKTPSVFTNSMRIRKALLDTGFWPTVQQEQSRDSALRLIGETLRAAMPCAQSSGTARTRSIVIAPIGSFGLGTWTGTSDVDCLCIGPYSPVIFWSLALKGIRKRHGDGVNLLRRVGTHSGTLLELDVRGIKVNIKYCAAAAVAETWPDAMKRPPSDTMFSSLSQQSLASLKPARDMYYMLRSIPDLAQFRTAHLFLRAWAQSRGIFSSRFGYLGGFSLSVMLAVVSKALALGYDATDGPRDPITASHLIVAFFSYYSEFEWRTGIILDPCFPRGASKHVRATSEGMCILGWHSPNHNAAATSTTYSATIVADELVRARTLLSENEFTLERLLGGYPAAASQFLSRFTAFIRIDTCYWGSSTERGQLFSGWVESRCASLPIELGRALPHLSTRIWPARFVERTGNGSKVTDENAGEKSGSGIAGHEGGSRECHLIGLDWLAGPKAQDEDKLYEILDRFQHRVQNDQKYFDARVCFVGAAVIPSSHVSDLEATFKPASDKELCYYELDIGQDEPVIQEDDDEEVAEEGEHGEEVTNMAVPGSVRQPGSKLRSAIDVLNRIRWDGSMDTRDYVVGFEDRFIGVIEKPLSQWNSDQMDDEFIPQHRIVYFRRTTDGAVVWDRRLRKDDVFGSS